MYVAYLILGKKIFKFLNNLETNLVSLVLIHLTIDSRPKCVN